MTLVDEEYEPDAEVLGSIRKRKAEIEISGEIGGSKRVELEDSDDLESEGEPLDDHGTGDVGSDEGRPS